MFRIFTFLTSTFDSTFSTYLQATMAAYQFDNINACKTGSTDFDNLAVAYNPMFWLLVGSVMMTIEKWRAQMTKQLLKKPLSMFLNYTNENKDVTWYQPTKNLQAIAINPLTGDFDENGTVYWFKKRIIPKFKIPDKYFMIIFTPVEISYSPTISDTSGKTFLVLHQPVFHFSNHFHYYNINKGNLALIITNYIMRIKPFFLIK